MKMIDWFFAFIRIFYYNFVVKNNAGFSFLTLKIKLINNE